MDFFSTLLTVFLFVFLAELADKTQLLVFFLSSRYKSKSTFFGIFFSSAILMALVVFPIKFIKQQIPIYYVKIISGSLLVLFGIYGLFSKEEEENIRLKTFKIPEVLLVFSTFFIAEIGDRTQLAGISLALKYNKPLAVWIGCWMGLFLANVPVIFGGHYIMKKINPKYLKIIGAVLFLAFGGYILISTLINS